MEAMAAMQYSAVGIAPHDLAAGTVFLEQLQGTYNVPFVSANLVAKGSGKPLFKPYIIKQFGDISIGVLGLTGIDPATTKNTQLQTLAVLPWQDALQKILPEIANSADMIILLTSFSEKINRQIALQHKEINLILQAGNSTANKPPRLTGNALLTQTGSRGKYVGKIIIKWTAAGQWRQDFSAKRTKEINDRLDRINWRLGRLKKKNLPQALEENAQYQELLKTKTTLDAELRMLAQQDRQHANDLSTYRDFLVALAITLPEDPTVRTILNTTKQAVHELNKKRLTALRQKVSASNLSATMAGWQSCRACHPARVERWQKTDHAKAWETLVTKKQQFNQDCLICHVTLPTYDKEIVTRESLIASLSPEFHGVGCESCHGPGQQHIQAPEASKLRRPTAETCTTCHTTDHDDDFDFARKLKFLKCSGGEY